MATIYTTVQGDTWDSIAYAVYGDELKAQTLMESRANILLLDYQVFPNGIEVTAPDIDEDETYDEDLPDWRKDDEE